MRNTILIVFMLTLMPVAASAQFYTITKESKIMPPFVRDTIEYVDNKWNTEAGSINSLAKDTLNLTVVGQENSNRKSRNSDKSTSQKLSEIKPDKKLPELTILISMRKFSVTVFVIRKSCWRRPSSKRAGSALPYAGTSTTSSG